MTTPVANTALTDTFEYWRNRTNELADAMSTVVVTSSNPVTGNVEVSNQFTANVLVANSYIRGGDATTNGTLFISSNAQMSSGYSLIIETLSANNSKGVSGQVLFSGGPSSNTYWDSLPATGVTQLNSGNGLTGGPINSTGTLSVLPSTGIIVDAGGVSVNSSYITSIISTSDAASVGSNTALDLRTYSETQAGTAYSNSVIFSSNATNITSGTINSARLPSTLTLTDLTVTGNVSIAQANITSITLTDAATINWNTSLGQIATVTLAGNRTIAAPTNLKVGTYILHIIQDANGNRTLTWNSIFKWTGGFAPVLSSSPNARDVFSFISDGTNLYGSYLPDVK